MGIEVSGTPFTQHPFPEAAGDMRTKKPGQRPTGLRGNREQTHVQYKYIYIYMCACEHNFDIVLGRGAWYFARVCFWYV